MAKHILLYDADCSPCIRFKKAIDFLDVHSNLDFMSIDHAEENGLLNALPDAKRHSSFHLILPSKRLESGADALPTLILLLPAGRLASKMIVSVPGGRNLLSFLYSTVARLHEVGSCKMQSITISPSIDSDDLSRRKELKSTNRKVAEGTKANLSADRHSDIRPGS